MEKAINNYCPRSGELVSDDSLTKYRGYVVGFCNPHCRDSFANDIANDIDNSPNDRNYFDVVIKEQYGV